MEQALWTAPINGCEMDKRRFLDWQLHSLNESKKKIIINCKSQSFSLVSHFSLEVASEQFIEDLGTQIETYNTIPLKIHK